MNSAPSATLLATLSRSLLAAAAAIAGTAALGAQDGLRGSVRTIDGRTIAGVVTCDEQGQVRVQTATEPVLLTLAEVQSIARDDVVVAPTVTAHRVWLRSGLELPATRITGKPAATGKPTMLTVELPAGITIDVPLGTVRAIRHGGAERPEPTMFAADMKKPPGSDDLIYVVKDGKAQRSSVTVTGLSTERIAFLLRGNAVEFELTGLAAIVFGGTTGFAPDRQTKPRTGINLTTGEHLEGKLVALDQAAATCRLDEGTVVTVPLARLATLQVASDRLAWIHELTPTKVEQTPAFDRTWPWSIDRTPVGAGLVLGGKRFEHGLCLVPRTRLTYDLAGKFDVFEATIGIDDRTGPEAHAVFRVLVDDKVVFTSDSFTRGKLAEVLRIELNKGRTLVLEVDFGKNYDLGDYCVFAEPRLVQR